MSYTFTVSPLSAIQFLDTPALKRALGVPADATVFMYNQEQAEPFLRRSSPEDVTRWWNATQLAYAGQLRGAVYWDESRTFELTRDVYADQDLELLNLLAYVHELGADALATGLRARPRNQFGLDDELQRAAGARGFLVRFPQASIGADFFLPFATNVILEVTDWRGGTSRFGSLPTLARELADILALIATADSEAAVAGQNDIKHDDPLAGAYNAARIKLDLARVGLRENLPFWFSE